ncbi:MAG TPA: ABC transporter permease [Opitutaceae bacterium]|nr:ABC transporter permease [Opitutaceae bacterium]
MRLYNTTKIALRALRRNKMRSLLTALGLIIGVGAVIATVSIGDGAKSQVEAQVASLGQNVVTVFPGNFTQGGMRSGWGGASSLTIEDAEAIAREVPGAVAVSAESRDRQQVLANGLNWNTQVLGESPDYPSIRAWPFAAGASFSDQDVRSMAKVAIVGKTVADQLFPNEDPLGQTIRIRNIPFKIVGMLASKGFNLFGQDQDDIVIVPYTSHMRRVARRTNLSSILVQAVSAAEIDNVQQQITDLLNQRRNGREPDFTVRNQVELAQMATETSKTIGSLLLAVAIISMIVGGIGVMNIMLVSVTERTREIGTRLAVGAHGKDVMFQFLTEAFALAALGGLIGVGAGIGASNAISANMGWPIEISVFWCVLSFSISGLVGIVFGFFPAWKAAQLDPIEALRFE